MISLSVEMSPTPHHRTQSRRKYGLESRIFPTMLRLGHLTTNGEILAEVHSLWGDWIEAIGEPQDTLSVPMLDAADELCLVQATSTCWLRCIHLNQIAQAAA